MQKFYEYKIYSRLGQHKHTINPQNVLSEISISEDLNGGQGAMTLEIVGNSEDFELTDILEICEVSDENTEISPTFTGILEEITISEHKNHDQLTLEFLGLQSILTEIFYKNNWSRKFSKNISATTLLKEIINNFNTEYGDFSARKTQNLTNEKIIYFLENSIENNLPNVNLEFDNTNHLEAIEKIAESVGISFFIDATGLFTAKKEENFEHILLTMWREAIAYTQKIKKSDMANVYYFEWDNNISATFHDDISIAKYGIQEQQNSDSSIKNMDSLNIKWAEFLKKKSFPELEITILLKPQKTEKIKPWMRFTLQNVRNVLTNKQITKIDKNRENWTIYIWDFPSFGSILTRWK